MKAIDLLKNARTEEPTHPIFGIYLLHSDAARIDFGITGEKPPPKTRFSFPPGKKVRS